MFGTEVTKECRTSRPTVETFQNERGIRRKGKTKETTKGMKRSKQPRSQAASSSKTVNGTLHSAFLMISGSTLLLRSTSTRI